MGTPRSEQRGVHSLAQQCMLVPTTMPGSTLIPSTQPDRQSDPFLQTLNFVPMYMYKERKKEGQSETHAKGRAAALQTVASVMREAAFFTDHKSRVFENAAKTAKAGEGSKQPPVVNIHAYAAAAVYGAQAKLNTNTGTQEVPMMVICEWEGCGSRDIDDDEMTWQLESHF